MQDGRGREGDTMKTKYVCTAEPCFQKHEHVLIALLTFYVYFFCVSCDCHMHFLWYHVMVTCVHFVEEDKGKIAGEAQANAKWITRNTKPCPNCR